MDCEYFGVCGSCVNFQDGYEEQLKAKISLNKERFSALYNGEIAVFSSLASGYRARSEFKIWHDDGEISYAMHRAGGKGFVTITQCPQVSAAIHSLMPKLLDAIKKYELKTKLFGVDFLSASNGEIVVSLLYHKRLDDLWRQNAEKLAAELGIDLIGRSRKQKIVIGKDHVIESLHVKGHVYRYMHIENSFTQPNTGVNEKMIGWLVDQTSDFSGDLLELYCGSGNFTIALASQFKKILATEISKSSINAARVNMQLNAVDNIEFVRMSTEELVEALDGVREFRRMKEIAMDTYDLQTVFVDPPRAGMDEASCKFISRYPNILYISCNPETLKRDLQILEKTHTVEAMALFDQFAYTDHVEMGAVLRKRDASFKGVTFLK